MPEGMDKLRKAQEEGWPLEAQAGIPGWSAEEKYQPQVRISGETGDEQMEETLTYYGVRLTEKCWLRKEMQSGVGYWVVVPDPGQAMWWGAKAQAETLSNQYGGEVVEMGMVLNPQRDVLTETTEPGIVPAAATV